MWIALCSRQIGHSEFEPFDQGMGRPCQDVHQRWATLTLLLDVVADGFVVYCCSGTVEGNVSRIKVIKRQMSDRAKFDLLRKRVLAE